MGKYGRLGVNTILVFIGNAGSKLIGLLMLPFYTNWLSVEDYGITDIINVYVTLLSGIVTCSIFNAVFVFPKGEELNRQRAYFSSGLLFSLTCLMITAISFYALNWVLKYQEVVNNFTNYTWYIFCLLGTMILQTYVQSFLRSINKMLLYSLTGIVMTISTAILSFIFIPQNGVFGYVYSLILANLIGFLFSLFASKAYKYFNPKLINWKDCKAMLKYSLPLIPNNMMWWLVSALNRPLMEAYSGMYAVGLYAVANKLPSTVTLVYNVFSNSWQVSVLEEFSKDGYKKFYNNIFKIFFLALILFSCSLAIGSKYIIELITNENFHEAWKYIPTLTFSAVFSAISGFVGANFSATRESKYFFYSSLWGAISSIALNFLLIPMWGIWGAVISVFFSQVIAALSRIKYSWKYVQITGWWQYFCMILVNLSAIFITLHIDSLFSSLILFLIVILILLLVNRNIIKESAIYLKQAYVRKKE